MTPIRFEYWNGLCKVYLSILNQFKHHYTSETIYLVREEGETGFVVNSYYGEADLLELLEQKVEAE